MMLIQTEKNFQAALTALLMADQVAIDTETNGLYVHEGHRLAGISTYCKLHGQDFWLGAYFPFRHALGESLFDQSYNLPLEYLRELNSALSRPELTTLWHNSKFDMGMLRADGIEINGPFYDTAVLAHLCNENGSHKLKDLAAERWGEQVKEEQEALKAYLKGSKRYDLVPPKIMEPYAVQDARLTFQLTESLLAECDRQDLRQLWEKKKMEFSLCLLEMEWYGMLVDTELAEQLSVEAASRMRQIEDQLGFDPLKLDLLAHKLYANPPDGLGLMPGPLSNTSTPEFPRGRPALTEAVLARYEHPLCDIVLEYRGLVKANSSWYQGFQQRADANHRVHPSFNQCATEESRRSNKEQGGTKTGRLTCSRPNMQQLPRNIEETPVKRLIIAPPRFRVYEFDYSQIELREAACYANAEPLLDAFRNGEDPHKITADHLGIERTPAKHATYTVLYGGGAAKLKETIERLTWQETHTKIEFPEERAAEIIHGFYEIYPGFRTATKLAERTMRNLGYCKAWDGSKRHIIEPWNMHKAFNSVIQRGAAAIVEESMLRFYRQAKDKPYKMISQVHDALWFEVPDDFREEYIDEIVSIMEWPIEIFPIPFPVDSKWVH